MLPVVKRYAGAMPPYADAAAIFSHFTLRRCRQRATLLRCHI
jgi:hypothetical protein